VKQQKQKFILKSIPFLIVLIISLNFYSCVRAETYWYNDSAGAIRTNDVIRLQQTLPFKIVLPKYLPKDLSKYKPEFIFSRDEPQSGDIRLLITYWNTESLNAIHIDEFISPTTVGFLTPDPRLSYNYLTVKDTKIMERLIDPNNNQGEIEYIYRWITYNINFQSEIEGYNQEETRKIIGSMFE
jgi:hypothetical protein